MPFDGELQPPAERRGAVLRSSRTLAGAVLSIVVAAACGPGGVAEPDDPDPTTDPSIGPTGDSSSDVPVALVVLPERPPSEGDPTIAGRSVTDFGFHLVAAAADANAPGDNLVVSPLSVAVALGMVEPGLSGDAPLQLHALLRIDDPDAWHASMSALEQSLEARQPTPVDPHLGDDQDPGELTVRMANGAFLQPGYPFRTEYLDAVGTHYGAVLEELDFLSDQAAAARWINAFIADATNDRITDLVQPEEIDPDTVLALALANAMLLQASWRSEFDAARTVDDGTFTLLDDSHVTVPMMHGGGDRSGRGDWWVGASKQLVGGLRFEVVLPDVGRFDEVAARHAAVVDELAASPNPGGDLVVPRFETRVNTPLTDVLQQLGLVAPFSPGSMLGVADDPLTEIDKVLHEAWVSVDEQGIEAAAATVVLITAASAPVDEPVPVVLDRPFTFRIVDDPSGAALFVGRVLDPTA